MEKIDKNILHTILTDIQKYKVLYVEDHIQAREETLILLKNYFTHISVAINGEEGYQKFLDEDFDIVFTDLDMPIMDGIEMIKQIRKHNLIIPIVVLSAHDDKEFILEALNEGIDGYILKPYTTDKIVNILRRVLLVLQSNTDDDVIELSDGFSYHSSNKHLRDINKYIIKLSKKELSLLQFLIENKNTYLSSEQIIEKIYDGESGSSKLRSLVSRIHKKTKTPLIESHYGYGYKLITKNN